MTVHHGDVSDLRRLVQESESSTPEMSMMRIAVAGTGGLARLIAHFINQDTSHQVVLLSRQEQPQVSRLYQVSVVDYSNPRSLQYALRGIDTVISTVTGPNQIELIKAAVAVRVRRFAPAEFEGLPALRSPHHPLDRNRSSARQWLSFFSGHIETTAFVCGVFYERFQPGGLRQSWIGLTSGVSGEGDYIMNCRTMSAQVPCYDANSQPVTICMTAAQDVAQFVTKALDISPWPTEFRMCGTRIKVMDLVQLAQGLRQHTFHPIQWHGPDSLRSALQIATARGDHNQQLRLHMLIATVDGHYDFTSFNMNERFPRVRVLPFQEWFVQKWNSQ